jgi:hypothetical protein
MQFYDNIKQEIYSLCVGMEKTIKSFNGTFMLNFVIKQGVGCGLEDDDLKSRRNFRIKLSCV